MPAPDPAAAVLACDLDGTYVTVNTFPRFTVFALRRLVRQGRWAAALRIAVALLRRRLLGLSHTDLKAAVHAAARQLPDDVVADWVVELLQAHTNTRVTAMVADWVGTTVLATAAPSVYAEPIARAAGFTHCSASELSNDGYVDNMSEVKARRLAALVGPVVECAVTDEEDVDLALLQMGRTAYLIGTDGRPVRWCPPGP